jgi:hypothetical protein
MYSYTPALMYTQKILITVKFVQKIDISLMAKNKWHNLDLDFITRCKTHFETQKKISRENKGTGT